MRKHTRFLGSLLAMACALCFSSATAEPSKLTEAQRLQLPEIRIQAAKYVFGPGEKINLSVSIDNSGQTPIRIFDCGLWDAKARRVAPGMTFVLSRKGADKAANSQSGEKPVKGKSYFMLNAGERSECGIDLTSWCGSLEPGVYSFSVQRMVGAAVADSNVFIFEVADSDRLAEINKMSDVVSDFVRSSKDKDIKSVMSLDGVWVEVDKGRRMLYVQELASELIAAMNLPRSKNSAKKILYMPGYEAFFLASSDNDGGELFFLRLEAGRYRVRNIRNLQ